MIVSQLRHVPTQTLTQAPTFTADFKLGHYAKVKRFGVRLVALPVNLLIRQIVGAMVAAITQVFKSCMFSNVPYVLTAYLATWS